MVVILSWIIPWNGFCRCSRVSSFITLKARFIITKFFSISKDTKTIFAKAVGFHNVWLHFKPNNSGNLPSMWALSKMLYLQNYRLLLYSDFVLKKGNHIWNISGI